MNERRIRGGQAGGRWYEGGGGRGLSWMVGLVTVPWCTAGDS